MDKNAWDSWNSWFVTDSKQRSLLGWEGTRKNYAGEFLNMVDDDFSRNDD